MTRVAANSPEIIRSLAIKRRNAWTALATGGALAAYAAHAFGIGRPAWLFALCGLAAGLLYANLFEYVLHRFPLHWASGFLARQHGLHHDSEGTPDEARYVNFASSPFVVVLLFAGNALPVFLVERIFHPGLAPGMLCAFTAYYIAYEEIHWRMHLGGWLPGWLRSARRHHMMHHGGFEGRYNVFLPLCDWLFQRRHWKSSPR